MATTTINNWSFEKAEAHEREIRALERAKRQEEKLLKKGYCWIKINDRLKAFVPCDKNGNPTTEGMIKIKRLKISQGIK